MDDVAGRQRILVVDDEWSMRRALCRLLKARFQVCEAPSCEAALEVLDQKAAAIDLVLLDIQFPAGTMQGTEAVSLIRSRWPHLPVVMLSVHHDVGLALHFGALGVRDYLAKLDGLHCDPPARRGACAGGSRARAALGGVAAHPPLRGHPQGQLPQCLAPLRRQHERRGAGARRLL